MRNLQLSLPCQMLMDIQFICTYAALTVLRGSLLCVNKIVHRKNILQLPVVYETESTTSCQLTPTCYLK